MYCFRQINTLKTPVITQPRRHLKPSLFLLAGLVVSAIIISTITAVAGNDKDSVSTKTPPTTTTVLTTQATTKPTSAATEKNGFASAVVEQASTAVTVSERSESAQEPSETTSQQQTTKRITTTTESKEVIITSGVLKRYPAAKSSKSYTVPYQVKRIADGAFEVNTHLTSLKFSKRENLECDWSRLFSALPNLKTIYIYPGTTADTLGMQYFDGEIIYYYD